MKRSKPYYPIRIKKQAVQMVAAELLSEDEACRKFKISRTLLHQWQRWHDTFFIQPHLNSQPMAKKKLSDQEKIEQLQKLKKIRKIREEMPGLGTRKLHHLTVSYRRKHGIKLGRDRMYDLLRRENMLISFRKRRTRTTYSDHSYVRYKNLIEDLQITAINQLYVSDITYIPVGNRFAYLSLITDAYSRKIIGWHLHKSLHAEGALKALKMALHQKDASKAATAIPPNSLIHHSDRGIQYCCHDYIKILKKHEILISMTNSPDPLENPLAERMHRTLKEEFGLERGFSTFELAQEAIARTIFIYNNKYPHGSLGYLTPNQVHNGRKPGKKRWKKYRKRVDPAALETMVA
ncbi:MAG: IS3 family transposase [Cyclobacteriaceae bacterium]